MHGSWETFTGHHTALLERSTEDSEQKKLNVRWAVQKFINDGAPSSKILLGLATYGRSFTLSDPSQTTMGSPAKSAGTEGTVI